MMDEEYRVHFSVLEVSRSPEALVHSLEQQEELETCLELLRRAGHETIVTDLSCEAPKWFVEPSLVAPISTILQHNGVQFKVTKDLKTRHIILLLKDLKARHIIVSKKYDLAVRRAVDSIKKKYHVRIKHDVSCEALVDDVADDDSLCSVHTLDSLNLESVRELQLFLREHEHDEKYFQTFHFDRDRIRSRKAVSIIISLGFLI